VGVVGGLDDPFGRRPLQWRGGGLHDAEGRAAGDVGDCQEVLVGAEIIDAGVDGVAGDDAQAGKGDGLRGHVGPGDVVRGADGDDADLLDGGGGVAVDADPEGDEGAGRGGVERGAEPGAFDVGNADGGRGEGGVAGPVGGDDVGAGGGRDGA